jgi:hypothetical protein
MKFVPKGWHFCSSYFVIVMFQFHYILYSVEIVLFCPQSSVFTLDHPLLSFCLCIYAWKKIQGESVGDKIRKFISYWKDQVTGRIVNVDKRNSQINSNALEVVDIRRKHLLRLTIYILWSCVSQCTYNEIAIVAGEEYLNLFSLRIAAYCYHLYFCCSFWQKVKVLDFFFNRKIILLISKAQTMNTRSIQGKAYTR